MRFKTFGILAAFAALTYLVVMFVVPPDPPVPEQSRLPWQITVLPDGSSQVFGITLGETSVGEAQAILRKRVRLGLFATPGEPLALEAYYGEITLGGLSGQLMTGLDLPQERLEGMRARSESGDRLDSGAIRLKVHDEDARAVMEEPITNLTYVPYVDLGEAVVLQRFGEPAERVGRDQGEHWLYPWLGLDIFLNEAGRAVLQYVPPRDFERLRAPLLEEQPAKEDADA